MHARFELPSSLSTRTVLPYALQPGGRTASRSTSKQAIIDGSDSGVVGANFLRTSISAQCLRPDAGHDSHPVHANHKPLHMTLQATQWKRAAKIFARAVTNVTGARQWQRL
jgi:hypothetical protein